MERIKNYYDFRVEELKKSDNYSKWYHLGGCEALIITMYLLEVITAEERETMQEELTKIFEEK